MSKNNFMEVKNKTDNSADLYFYGDIVSSAWGKWEETDSCPEDVLAFLKEVEGVKELSIYINSGGGSVFAGLAIYNMLKRNTANKTVHIDGLAGSIASIIAMCGDKIIMPSNAFLMIHKPSNISVGNANDFRKMADTLDVIEEGLINVYAEKIKEGVDIEVIKQMLNEETWLTGSKASEYFNVEVVAENKAVAMVGDLSNYKNAPKELLNKITSSDNKEKKLIEDNKSFELAKAKLRLQLDLI